MFTRMPLAQPLEMLRYMRNALVDVVASLSEMPGRERELVNMRTLLNMLNSVTAHDSEQIGLYHHLENSRLFCKSIAEYIYNQSAEFCMGCIDHPIKEKRQLFTDQKKALFDNAKDALQVTASDVYEYVNSCEDLIAVNEVKYFYGGAGRTCWNYKMTRIFTKMEDAEKFAFNYLMQNTPEVNYMEIFEALEKGRHTNRLFPEGHEILREHFKDPKRWIGSRMFFEWLKKSGVTLEEYWKDYDEIFSECEWLRPYLRIDCNGSEQAVCHNLLNFDPGHGCRWDIRPYSFYERMCSPPIKG